MIFLPLIHSNCITHVLLPLKKIQHLSNFALTCKSAHDFCRSNRHIWLHVALRRTGYKSPAPVDVKSDDFWYKLRLLLCPWLSVPRDHISFCYNEDDALITSTHLGISKCGKFLVLKVTTDDMEDEVFVASSRTENFGWYKASDKMKWPNKPRCPNVLISGNNNVICRVVHSSAIAVIEFFPGDRHECNGVYFVSTDNFRVLRHLRLNPFESDTEVDICSIPCEMWFYANDTIHYFAPRDDRLMIEDSRSLMGQAISFVAKDDAPGAIAYLRHKGLGMDTRTYIDDRTILHMAVEWNRPLTVRNLLDANADPNIPDDNGLTPLGIAARYLHIEVIKVLKGRVDPKAGTSPLHLVGTSTSVHTHLPRAICLLLQCGCDMSARNAEGKTVVEAWEERGMGFD
jgi:uncharacterized protein